MQTKNFHLGDVLSVVTGRLLSLRGMDGLYDILNFMTGDNLFTHQLPRASDECKPWLLKQYPELAKVDTSKNIAKLETLVEDSAYHEGSSPATAVEMWLKWMAEPCECDLKMEYNVQQIPKDAHLCKNPIEEIMDMIGDKQ